METSTHEIVNIEREIIETECYSGNHYLKTEKKGKMELVEVLNSLGDRIASVTFNKK